MKARSLKMAVELRLTERQRSKMSQGDRGDVSLYIHQMLVNGDIDEAIEGVTKGREYAIAELLADIRHWCDDKQLSFHEVDRRAYRLYCGEISALSWTKRN